MLSKPNTGASNRKEFHEYNARRNLCGDQEMPLRYGYSKGRLPAKSMHNFLEVLRYFRQRSGLGIDT
jgi:hypothetical protein